ncbi:MAG: hypothetical protein JOZ30_08150 [Hyphomicrobiales bacterium]|nr:hypothetical protein [Hyphomicrobiales bacterium]
MPRRIILATIIVAALSSLAFAATLPQIAAGPGGSYLIKSDGTLWAWGDYAGRVSEKKNLHALPVKMEGVSDLVAISAGDGHSITLKKDGTVWPWGNNADGQLGNGAKANDYFPTPVQVSSLSDIKAVAAGNRHSLALKSDGTLWAWGNNLEGQLGNGTKVNAAAVVQVRGLSDVAAVAAGMGHSLASRNDGTVWAWGYNDDGELGDGTRKAHLTPAQIPGLLDVRAIAAGSHHSLALKNDGTVWMWGGQASGGFGQSTTPRRVKGLSQIAAISAGGWYSLALKQDGTVWAWGVIADADQDDDTMNAIIKKPVQVHGLTNVVRVAAGMWHSLAIEKDGTTWAWGRNYSGALGDGTQANRASPVRASILDENGH